MKIYLSLGLILFTTLQCTSTNNTLSKVDSQEYIKKDFYDYIMHISNQEFDEAMNYIVPALFEYLPRESMIQVMEQSFNAPDMIIKLRDPKILKVGEIVKIEETYYAKMKYANYMDLKFVNEVEDTTQVMLHDPFMLESLATTFGKENVNFDDESGFFQIYVVKECVAVSKSRQQDWKFLVIEKSQEELIKQILPSSIIDIKL